MSHRWVDHTAELELELHAPTRERVFGEALTALAELLADELPSHPGEPRSIQVTISGRDRALLLADWLDELVFRAETENLIPQSIEHLELDEDGLRATVRAFGGSPRPLVKGITHHRLEFAPSSGGFHARLVLDV